MKKLALLLTCLLLFSPIQAQEEAAPWWRDRVFYEIFVRSFYDSDGDGVGDLQGIIEKLDYLNDGDPATDNDLGITGLWLMPVTEALSYHGYDTLDYRRIEQDYGTREDFRQLVEAAHARGIAVIVDLVINHTSDRHPWFAQSLADPNSPYADYYVWQDAHPGGNAWHSLNSHAYYGWFWSGMPDLNYTNPRVTQEMYDIARFWLEEMGVDGFRLDAVKYIIEEGDQLESTSSTFGWLQAFKGRIKSVNPDALIVGEVWSSSLEVARYVPRSLDMGFEFDLAATIIDSAKRRSNQGLVAIQQRALERFPPGQYATFLTNHDQNRVMTEVRGDLGTAKVAASILLTSPGLPFIYYGEEIGMTGQKPDERIRTPMQWNAEPDNAGFTSGTPWQPLDASYETANVVLQRADPDSLLNHYRALIHLRNAHPALQTGTMLLIDSPRQIYSFLRQHDDETLLVIINLNSSEMTDYMLTLAEGPLTTPVDAELIFGAGGISTPQITDSGGFADYVPLPSLPPRSTTIIRLL